MSKGLTMMKEGCGRRKGEGRKGNDVDKEEGVCDGEGSKSSNRSIFECSPFWVVVAISPDFEGKLLQGRPAVHQENS